MKYGVIVLSYWNDLYDHFDKLNSILAYKNNVPIKFVFNHTTQSKTLLPCDMFFQTSIGYPQCLLTMLEKFIWAWKQLKELPEWKACDYIIRANSSTFLNHTVLQQYINKLPITECFAGHIMFNEFISGTCMIFSKDVLNKLEQRFTENYPIRYRDHDDCIIRDLLKDINKIDMEWGIFDKNIQPPDNDIDKALEYPIIRIRNDLSRKEIDTWIWNKLFEKTI